MHNKDKISFCIPKCILRNNLWKHRIVYRSDNDTFNVFLKLLKIKHVLDKLKESIKTTSMENVSTGVIEKNKEQYLRSKDKAEKWYDISRHI